MNAVLPAEQLKDTVESRVDDILNCSPLAVRAKKQIAQRSLDHASLADADYPAVGAMLASHDAQEGQSVFVEKRKPGWRVPNGSV